jgi:hypothetical protein
VQITKKTTTRSILRHVTSPIIDPLPRPGAFGSHAVTPTTQAPIRRPGFGAADVSHYIA